MRERAIERKKETGKREGGEGAKEREREKKQSI